MLPQRLRWLIFKYDGGRIKPYGIRVHCLAPGRTATELRKVLAPDEDQSTIMQPDAVARVTRFLIGRC